MAKAFNPIVMKLVCGPTALKAPDLTKDEYKLLIDLVDAARELDANPTSIAAGNNLRKALVNIYGSEELLASQQ